MIIANVLTKFTQVNSSRYERSQWGLYCSFNYELERPYVRAARLYGLRYTRADVRACDPKI